MITTQSKGALASRAMGAMFLFVFGGAWLVCAAFQSTAGLRLPAIILTVVCTAALSVFAYRRCRMHRPSLVTTAPTSEQRAVGRAFNLINLAQWVAIVVVVGVCANLGLSRWIVPGIIVIVGLHFLPLAHVFRHPQYYVTGAALVVLAVAYPLLAPRGPASPVGCLGAGIILWISAFRALAR